MNKQTELPAIKELPMNIAQKFSKADYNHMMLTTDQAMSSPEFEKSFNEVFSPKRSAEHSNG